MVKQSRDAHAACKEELAVATGVLAAACLVLVQMPVGLAAFHAQLHAADDAHATPRERRLVNQMFHVAACMIVEANAIVTATKAERRDRAAHN